MKRLTITIDGEDTDDLDLALNRILHQVNEGYREGFDRSETGRYEYAITEDAEKVCKHCGAIRGAHQVRTLNCPAKIRYAETTFKPHD